MRAVTNRRKVEVADEFYPTPPWATQALVDVEPFEGTVMEPACGDGAMARVLEAAGHDVLAFDLIDRGYGMLPLDFLDQPVDALVDNIVTNPPYDLAGEFFEQSWRLARRKVCFLLRLAFLEGRSRRDKVFATRPPARVWVFSKRITFYPAGKQTGGSGTTAYAWFVWDKSVEVRAPELKWL